MITDSQWYGETHTEVTAGHSLLGQRGCANTGMMHVWPAHLVNVLVPAVVTCSWSALRVLRVSRGTKDTEKRAGWQERDVSLNFRGKVEMLKVNLELCVIGHRATWWWLWLCNE